jgi:uncharacterized membrane protein YgcG
VSDTWPSVLPTTAPIKPINDYSGEFSAHNILVLTTLAQRMHYKPHVLIMPRSVETSSADQLAATIAQEWKLGPDDLTLVVDLKGNSIGASVGSALANKGVDGAYLHQMLAPILARHSSHHNDHFVGIRRVMNVVDRAYVRGVVSPAGSPQTAARPVAPANAHSSSGGIFIPIFFFLFLIVFIGIFAISLRNAKSGMRRISLPKNRDIGDDVDEIKDFIGQSKEHVQIPLKEFAKRVHVKNDLEDGGDDLDSGALAGSPADARKVPIGAAFLKKRTGEVKRFGAEDTALADEGLIPTEATNPTSFAEMGVSSSTAADRTAFAEAGTPSPEQSDQAFFAPNDVVEPKQQRPRPELERDFQKSLGDYGDQMVATDANSSQTAADLASVDTSAELKTRVPPSFLEMPQDNASTPSAPDSPVMPGPLPMPERPVESANRVPPPLPGGGWTLPVAAATGLSSPPLAPTPSAQPAMPAQAPAEPPAGPVVLPTELDAAALAMPPSPSYNLSFDGGFPDFSKPFANAQTGEATAGAEQNKEQKLCSKCGAERSADFAFCLKCGQMFV